MNKELLYYLVLRENFGEFIKSCFKILHQKPLELNWHHKVLVSELENCRRGENKRLVVNLPPRQLKSEICSVYYPLYLLGNTKENTDIMIITRNKKLGILWLEMIKALLDQPVIQNTFPSLKIINQKTDKLTTTKGSISIHSPNTPIIGAGADIFIIDDPMSVRDATNIDKVRGLNKWFQEELLTRMNDKQNGTIILAMQRIHLLDLSAFILHTQVEVKHLNIPALNEKEQQYNWQEWNVIQRKFIDKSYTRPKNEPINPERETQEALQKLEKQMGKEAFATQYQQNPVVDFEQELFCKLKDLAEIPTIKKGRLVINCYQNKDKIMVMISLTNRDKYNEVFIIKYLETKIPETIEDFIVKIIGDCQIESAYINDKYRAELQLVVICPMLKTTKNLEERLDKLRMPDINISSHIVNKILISEKQYQEAITHLFTEQIFDNVEIYSDDKFQGQLKSNLQKLAPTPFIRLLIENVAVQGK